MIPRPPPTSTRNGSLPDRSEDICEKVRHHVVGSGVLLHIRPKILPGVDRDRPDPHQEEVSSRWRLHRPRRPHQEELSASSNRTGERGCQPDHLSRTPTRIAGRQRISGRLAEPADRWGTERRTGWRTAPVRAGDRSGDTAGLPGRTHPGRARSSRIRRSR